MNKKQAILFFDSNTKTVDRYQFILKNPQYTKLYLTKMPYLIKCFTNPLRKWQSLVITIDPIHIKDINNPKESIIVKSLNLLKDSTFLDYIILNLLQKEDVTLSYNTLQIMENYSSHKVIKDSIKKHKNYKSKEQILLKYMQK